MTINVFVFVVCVFASFAFNENECVSDSSQLFETGSTAAAAVKAASSCFQLQLRSIAARIRKQNNTINIDYDPSEISEEQLRTTREDEKKRGRAYSLV